MPTELVSATSLQSIVASAGAAVAAGASATTGTRSRHASVPATALAASNSRCGMPGSSPSSPSTPATGVHARELANCDATWPARSSVDDTRVTIIAAAIDSSSAGICATSPSPIANSR